jgi:hypothetical protein
MKPEVKEHQENEIKKESIPLFDLSISAENIQ